MACHLFGAKPLSKPMITYRKLDPKEHNSMKYLLKFKEMHLQILSAKWLPFRLGINVLNHSVLYTYDIIFVTPGPLLKHGLTKNRAWIHWFIWDIISHPCPNFNILSPRQNGRHFAGNICKSIFLNANIWISIKISLMFVSKDQIDNIPP